MALAIECGASHSVAVFVPEDQVEIVLERTVRYHFGPANFKLLKPLELEKYFLNVAETVQEGKSVTALAVAMPGVLNDTDRNRLKNVLGRVWPHVDRLWVGNDLESSMARMPTDTKDTKDYLLQVVAISGTGSCCFGTDGTVGGHSRKIGGYGHVLGDRGSGYSIAHRALRAALRDYEHNHDDAFTREAYGGTASTNAPTPTKTLKIEESASSTPLLTLLLYQLNMVEIYELVSWSLVASKHEVAELATVVITAAQFGNSVAQTVLEEATKELADDIVCLVNKLKAGRDIPDRRICIGLTGSMLTRNRSTFTERIIEGLRTRGCHADVTIVTDTVLGALKKVVDLEKKRIPVLKIDGQEEVEKNGEDVTKKVIGEEDENLEEDPSRSLRERILPKATGLAETERRNIRSMGLSSMATAEAVELMIDEEARSNRALREHVSAFVALIERITTAFKAGGRLLYVGAGTSGRLGILDASECPPTFKAPPHWVQGIIAGGTKAIQSSIEGAEDSIEDGIASIIDKDVCDKDVVLGIAACGRTPFVWGALYEALRRGAYTAMLTFNPHLESRLKLDQMIMINSGAEVLTGSTRLKAGTGTKVVLNMLTTLSMVRYGKCIENLMVDLMPANEKLRDRALRITMMIVDDPTLTVKEAEAVLVKNQYDIKATVEQLRHIAGQQH